jgi:hypothetical protein
MAESVHAVLRGVISDGGQLQADDRPSFDDIWERLREVEFRVLPCVDVEYPRRS